MILRHGSTSVLFGLHVHESTALLFMCNRRQRLRSMLAAFCVGTMWLLLAALPVPFIYAAPDSMCPMESCSLCSKDRSFSPRGGNASGADGKCLAFRVLGLGFRVYTFLSVAIGADLNTFSWVMVSQTRKWDA